MADGFDRDGVAGVHDELGLLARIEPAPLHRVLTGRQDVVFTLGPFGGRILLPSAGVWRAYDAFSKAPADQATGDLLRVAMSGFCFLLMLYFGVSSFRRARRISRS